MYRSRLPRTRSGGLIVVRGSACEAASCTSRNGTPASSAAVIDACLSVCGPTGFVIPARRATFRTIQTADFVRARFCLPSSVVPPSSAGSGAFVSAVRVLKSRRPFRGLGAHLCRTKPAH